MLKSKPYRIEDSITKYTLPLARVIATYSLFLVNITLLREFEELCERSHKSMLRYSYGNPFAFEQRDSISSVQFLQKEKSSPKAGSGNVWPVLVFRMSRDVKCTP